MLRYSEAGYAPHYSRVHIEIPDLEKIKKIDEEFIGLGDEIKDLSLKVLRSALKFLNPQLEHSKHLCVFLFPFAPHLWHVTEVPLSSM